MKQIAEAKHLALTYTGVSHKTGKGKVLNDLQRFAKRGEQQKAAIKRLMTSRRKELTSVSGGGFPKFKPGMTTAEYIRLFSIGREVLPYALHRLDRPAPIYEGPEVVCEADDLLPEDLA